MSKQKGFTLIEIMVTLLIIGVIISVSFINYTKTSENKALADAKLISKMIESGKKRAMIFNQITGLRYTEEGGMVLVRFTGAGFGTTSIIADPSMWAVVEESDTKIILERNPNRSTFALHWNKTDPFIGTDEEEGVLPFMVIFNDGTITPDGELDFVEESSNDNAKLVWKVDGSFEIK